MIPVRQSTAFEVAVGPVLDASGVAVTDCVVGDFKLKKTTGNFAALNGSATLTHVSAGTYDLVLTTSDVDTVGLATVAIDDTVNGCAPLYLQVVEEAVYDALFAANAAGYQVPIWAAANSTVNLSATTIKTATDVETDTADIQSRLPAALGANGNIKADVRDYGGTAATTSGGRPEVNSSHIGGQATSASGTITFPSATLASTTNITAASGITLAASQSATTFASLTCTGAFTVSDGFVITCSTANKTAFSATGDGTGHGMLLTGGSTNGTGLRAVGGATNGTGIHGVGTGTGSGMALSGGSGTASAGLEIASLASATGYGVSITGSGTGDGHGVIIGGGGNGDGITIAAGDTLANGITVTGGLTSGDAIDLSATNGHAIDAAGTGTGKFGFDLTGTAGGLGIGGTSTTAQTGDVYASLTGAHSEPTGVPAADASILTKIGTLFMMLRNKVTVTSTKKTYYDDGDAAEFEKDLSDDGTTYTESEVNSI